jgi:hypothetical protein
MEIKIKNFKLNVFRNLLEQSLIVDNQLMFEWTPEMVRSCSFSTTKSFIKLWLIPLQMLIVKPEKEETAELFPEQNKDEKLEFPTFNMYILKGDLFKKFLSVHTSDMVDLTFMIQEVNGKHFASNITITSKSEVSNELTTNFVLTTEELISNSIEDYSQIIKEATPSKNMFEFMLSNTQIQEIKRLIKKLHKSSADNTAYLTFTIDSERKKIIVNDKVFNIEFEINPEIQKDVKFPDESFKFNVLKSDFIIAGNQTFSIYTCDKEEKVIFGARFAGSIIWCLSSKISEQSELNLDASVLDSTIDALDMQEYLEDL